MEINGTGACTDKLLAWLIKNCTASEAPASSQTTFRDAVRKALSTD